MSFLPFFAMLLHPLVSRAMTIAATDPAFVLPVGRPYPSTYAPGALGLSWLGGGMRVAHNGTVLRATFAPTTAGFKVRVAQSSEGYFPIGGVLWVPGSNVSETLAIASGAGTVELVMNTAAQYIGGRNGRTILLSLTTDGAFLPAPPPQARTMHVLGDSVTAATNIQGGVGGRCSDGGLQNDYSASWGGMLCAHFDASCSTVAVGGERLPDMQAYYQQWWFNGPPFPFNDTAPQAFLSYMGINDMYNQNQSAALDAQFAAHYLSLINATQRSYPRVNITFFLILGPMVAGQGAPTSPLKLESGTLLAVQLARSNGLDAVFVTASGACGGNLTGCLDGCGGGHPGESGHRAMALAALPIIAAKMGWEDNTF